MNRIRAAAVLLAAALVPACGDGGLEDSVISASPGVPGGVSWSGEVWPILRSKCQSCHMHGVAQAPDMHYMSANAAYAGMVGIPAACTGLPAGTMRVVPGNPAASFLWEKVNTAGTPRCGTIMPQAPDPPLSIADQMKIYTWISQGAPNN